jgi:hypothetical protein
MAAIKNQKSPDFSRLLSILSMERSNLSLYDDVDTIFN